MKKFLLFVSTVFFSLFLVNNKVHAQEFPEITMKVPYYEYSLERTHQYTYEYFVHYGLENIIVEELGEMEYYFISSINVPFYKGYDNRFNSYELDYIIPFDPFHTEFVLRVTIDIRIVDDEYNGDMETFFRDGSAFYITYQPGPDSIDYQAGYNDGYNNGYNDGFQVGNENGYNSGFNEGYDEGFDYGRDVGRSEGYNDGYDDGYDQGIIIGKQFSYEDGFIDGQEFGYNLGYDDASKLAISKFQTNLHVWIVPAIIIVVIAGIFVGYRRERYGGD